MKKRIIFIALLASAIGGLQAQDTVWMKPGPLANYFNNNWPDTTQKWSVLYHLPAVHAVARRFVTQDTLEVYGIAAMMINEWDNNLKMGYITPTQLQAQFDQKYPDDPTLDHCEESLLLFQYYGNNGSPVMQQLGDSLHVHSVDTVPSYYVVSNTEPVSYMDTVRKAVYERYFSEPQIVSDTFYAGVTRNNNEFRKIVTGMDGEEEEIRLCPVRPYFICLAIEPFFGGYHYYEGVAHLRQASPDSACRWTFRNNEFLLQDAYIIFPILTPKPEIDTTAVSDTTIVTDTTVVVDTTIVIDTTVTDTTHVDTVAIRLPEFMGRYVSVSPNPATGSVEVLSSFGVNRVEAYNAAGRKMMDLKAEGLKATLDVSKLPSGTYLLRIHTPQGMTTKKLVVR